MKFQLVQDTQEAREQLDLELADGGTFTWTISRSELAGDAGGHDASGRYTRTGDAFTFEVTERSSKWAPVPTTASLRGDALEVVGFGTFDKA